MVIETRFTRIYIYIYILERNTCSGADCHGLLCCHICRLFHKRCCTALYPTKAPYTLLPYNYYYPVLLLFEVYVQADCCLAFPLPAPRLYNVAVARLVYFQQASAHPITFLACSLKHPLASNAYVHFHRALASNYTTGSYLDLEGQLEPSKQAGPWNPLYRSAYSDASKRRV